MVSGSPAHDTRIIVAERGIFVFNFSVSESSFGYPIGVPGNETRELVLDSGDIDFGGLSAALLLDLAAEIIVAVCHNGMGGSQ